MRKKLRSLLAIIIVMFILYGILVGAVGRYLSVGGFYETDELLFISSKSSNTASYFAYDDDGELICVCKEASGPAKSWVSLENVSPFLKSAFIAAEDRAFYRHNGVNIKRTMAAAVNSVLNYTGTFGASTITQQVIKNISGDNERSFRRKMCEILRAIRLEASHSKDEILEMYLNVIPMSGNLYGVREAALRYFSKEPSELGLAEAATLVGITNAPSKYDPAKHPDACLEKRNRVLYSMKDNGDIDESQYQDAVNTPLSVASEYKSKDEISSWFVETARENVLLDLESKYGVSRLGALMLLNSGTRVVLCMNPNVQRVMEDYFENTENLSAEVANGLQYSMVVADSSTGDIIGIIGAAGEKRGNRLFNYATAKHPPASTIKPISLYAPLIDSGTINWSTLFDDVPTETGEKNGEIYTYPKNSPDIYEGKINTFEALKKSKNTVASQMYEMLGAQRIYAWLKGDYGIEGIVEERKNSEGRIASDLSMAPLALGQLTDGIPLLDMTHAYTAFPGGGVLRGGRSYYGVFAFDGGVLLDNQTHEKRIMKESTASIMNMMLAGVADDGTAKMITLKESIDTAAKTGTSSGNRDKLLIGYTPRYTSGIWCGYSDGSRGVYTHAPNHIQVWDAVMHRLHNEITARSSGGEDGFSTGGLRRMLYCKESGCLANEECENAGNTAWGFFALDMPFPSVCTLHDKID